jgi:hypothetical protein
MPPPPSPLEYASATLKPVADVRFRLAPTLLITAALLAGVFDGLVGLLYIDRLGRAAAFLNTFAIVRFLSRQQPAFGRAALLTALATAAAFIAHILIETGYDHHKRQLLRGPVSPVVPFDTDPAARLATWEVTRYTSAAAACLLLLLTIYLIARRLQITRATRAQQS